MTQAQITLAGKTDRERAVRQAAIFHDVAMLRLTRGYETIIDLADLPLVKGRNWSALVTNRKIYAVRTIQAGGKQKMILMHRVITGAPDGMDADHKDGDGLNNRRINLRVCTHNENLWNSTRRSDNKSGFKGVFWEKRSQKWRAEIRHHGVAKHLGYFLTREAAHAAYSLAAHDLHGEFARPE